MQLTSPVTIAAILGLNMVKAGGIFKERRSDPIMAAPRAVESVAAPGPFEPGKCYYGVSGGVGNGVCETDTGAHVNCNPARPCTADGHLCCWGEVVVCDDNTLPPGKNGCDA